MVELYGEAGSEATQRIADALAELVVAHRVIPVTTGEARARFGPDAKLPLIVDGERVVQGDALPAWLEETERLMTRWQRFQSDACYLGDDGETC